MDAVDADTRLGTVLLRLRAALLDAEAERQVTRAFGDERIALVPRLRRSALVRTGSAGEADDLVQTTLMRAWEHRIAIADLQAALHPLPPGQRETLLLATVDGLGHEEAAALLGCQVGTVKSRVGGARERLASALGLAWP